MSRGERLAPSVQLALRRLERALDALEAAPPPKPAKVAAQPDKVEAKPPDKPPLALSVTGVALKRLVDEVAAEQVEARPPRQRRRPLAHGYNRVYHRHNR